MITRGSKNINLRSQLLIRGTVLNTLSDLTL